MQDKETLLKPAEVEVKCLKELQNVLFKGWKCHSPYESMSTTEYTSNFLQARIKSFLTERCQIA